MAVKDFIEELRWRGLLQDSMPGTAEHLNNGPANGYIGFDPTADSLHVGNLVQIMILVHFQRCGHKPIALVGGATGMVGDPSGKSAERNLLDEDALRHNQACIQAQLERFLDFKAADNPARLVNNYDWFKDMGFLRFIREVGKHISVNYMLAKDSVKNRMETGLSFTEFSYQLVQGFDYYWLWKNMGCTVQMGGSDQWGNITTGTELIRRMSTASTGSTPAFAVTTPLLTKADGSKFGKSESGNVWLDAARTSPYKFYQFWLNASDDDVARFARIFTTWEREEIEAREAEHRAKPGTLQKLFAADITRRTHGEAELNNAIEASNVLFGNATADALGKFSRDQLLDIFEGVPQGEVSRVNLDAGVPIIELLSDHSGFLPSRGEAKRALKENSISVNKQKVGEERIVASADLLTGGLLLLQRGKRNYFLVKVVG
ncbi:MAG: tyrosine--tRNA ligase [Flavobacteriales bacterium]|nr:tyrosine--tRNA ligase [Flavobacteriales bacterium]MBP6573355.1 tyrosine--tRNA ligase [Flavobacteriales bacterium]